MRRGVPLILFIAVTAAGVFAAFAGEDGQAIVDREISRIGRPPGAELKSLGSFHRPNNALATLTFTGALTFAQIRSFYDASLSGAGWRFVSERSVRDWGRDLGGKTLTYCKGGYVASVQYAGSSSQSGWNFALSMAPAEGTECKS